MQLRAQQKQLFPAGVRLHFAGQRRVRQAHVIAQTHKKALATLHAQGGDNFLAKRSQSTQAHQDRALFSQPNFTLFRLKPKFFQ